MKKFMLIFELEGKIKVIRGNQYWCERVLKRINGQKAIFRMVGVFEER